MTMYLPNRDIRPTGYEAGEFLESPPFPAPAPTTPAMPAIGDDDPEPGARSS
jgi:hypothetical protein